MEKYNTMNMMITKAKFRATGNSITADELLQIIEEEKLDIFSELVDRLQKKNINVEPESMEDAITIKMKVWKDEAKPESMEDEIDDDCRELF